MGMQVQILSRPHPFIPPLQSHCILHPFGSLRIIKQYRPQMISRLIFYSPLDWDWRESKHITKQKVFPCIQLKILPLMQIYPQPKGFGTLQTTKEVNSQQECSTMIQQWWRWCSICAIEGRHQFSNRGSCRSAPWWLTAVLLRRDEQNVLPPVRLELTAFRLWDWRAAYCATEAIEWL